MYIGAVSALSDLGNWVVFLTTLAAIALVIGLHYEALRGCIRYLPAVTHRRRRRVVLLILVILATHVVEIWIFAIAYFALLQFETHGAINGIGGAAGMESLLDHVYYSAMTYTTVGFGDFVPTGPIRFMTGVEALAGLVMITWSASFTFLEMQRDWPAERP